MKKMTAEQLDQLKRAGATIATKRTMPVKEAKFPEPVPAPMPPPAPPEVNVSIDMTPVADAIKALKEVPAPAPAAPVVVVQQAEADPDSVRLSPDNRKTLDGAMVRARDGDVFYVTFENGELLLEAVR